MGRENWRVPESTNVVCSSVKPWNLITEVEVNPAPVTVNVTPPEFRDTVEGAIFFTTAAGASTFKVTGRVKGVPDDGTI